MNEYFKEIAKTVAPGAHSALILDGAGWHDSADLVMPENITPVIPPPHLQEQFRREYWGYPSKNNLANRICDTNEEIVDDCCAV